MLGLVLVLIVVLQFEGTSGGELHLYHRAGDDVVLPCRSPSSSYSCSIVNWFYLRDPSTNFPLDVEDGKVVESSPRAARLNVDSNCSLIINNITAEDAGRYTCRPGSGTTVDGSLLLSVLTISPSPPEDDPTKDGDVTLNCSLERYSGLDPCPKNSLLWVDETGTGLTGEGVGFKLGPRRCASSLTVQHQSGTNRTYTCRFVVENSVKVEAHYTAVFKGTSGGELHLYHRAGDDVVLPCRSPSSSYSCSIVNWFYLRDPSTNFPFEVKDGKVVESSPRAARLNVDSNCSLIINNITAEDAGRYTCRPGSGNINDGSLLLGVLTISPSPPEDDPTKDGDVTLNCSLERYSGLDPCPKNSLLWVDETETGLTGEGVGFKLEPRRCASSLTVQHQSGTNRTYTCRFVVENSVKVEAHYTAVFKGTSGGELHLYHRAGDDVVLPCRSSSSSYSCSIVNWFYLRDIITSISLEVKDGKVVESSPRAARLNVDSNCSLIINNITAEDAGLYFCGLGSGILYDDRLFLDVLTISPSPPDADPTKDGDVTLNCSLERYSGFDRCPENSLLWVDETGTGLTGEGVGFKLEPRRCASSLTVQHQSGTNRTYTCRFVVENSVKVEAHYTAVFKGTSGGELHLYHRAGDDVVLPCRSSSSSYSCSIVNWFYLRDPSTNFPFEVKDGKVVESSPRAARLNVDSNCSLIINNITAEDAGRYTCRSGSRNINDGSLLLSVLTISPSPPEDDPTKDGDVTLNCSLERYSGLDPCPKNSLLWVDETGTGLTGEGVGFKLEPRRCASSLTVQHQSGTNRTYTCRFVVENIVKVEAHYTAVFKDFTDWSPLSFIMLTLRITGLILMVGITVGIIRTRGTSGGELHLYHRAGDDVVLPCRSPSSSYSCSIVNWFYLRDPSPNFPLDVEDGKVVESSPRAARLNVDSNCSLIINNITAEDAGRYTCRPGSGNINDGSLLLGVLTISPSPPEDDPTKDGDVTLNCSLERYSGLDPCPKNSLLWVDETGTGLTGEGVGFKLEPRRCASSLTVQHQSGTNRTYTCRFVVEDSVKVDAHYTAVFKGTSGGELHLYHRAGDDVVLPCRSPSSSYSCSIVNWFYLRDPSPNFPLDVEDGKVVESSPRAARLNVDSNCSLIINNITAEDAGRYTCRPGSGNIHDGSLLLGVLTISPSPPEDDPTKDGDVTLNCSLERYSELDPCPENSLLWVDETGTGLTGEGVGFKLEPRRCASSLTVQHQSGTNRTYTCRFVVENSVKVEAHYTAVFKDVPVNNTIIIVIIIIIIIIIILVSVIGVLLLLVVLAAVFVKLRKTRIKEDHRTTAENQGSTHESLDYDDVQNNLTYVTVDHLRHRNDEEIKVKQDEDTVTYSAVRTKKKREADIDPSGLYSYITKSQLTK
ncbi:titin-like isoform X2 [Girardinichthys multiradiatus]|uniref:titin-like isoform X2 n=1 Tax=Girardinichthys multiradiatus TaxID=208333 RepID=UPI001FAD5508|nr:titin-like isoform X2 [Girardinichthys multiradiatus]